MSTQRTNRFLLLGALLATGACAATSLRPESPRPRPLVERAPLPDEGISAPRSTQFTARSTPSDGNIAAILLAANNTEISYARLAQSRAESPAVKEFAQRMLTDHSAANERLNDVLNTSELVAADNRESLSFRDVSAEKREMLRKFDGAAFDSIYMANEVGYHTELLRSIDRDLQPLAAQPQLRQLVSDLRPTVAEHLASAQRLRAILMDPK